MTLVSTLYFSPFSLTILLRWGPWVWSNRGNLLRPQWLGQRGNGLQLGAYAMSISALVYTVVALAAFDNPIRGNWIHALVFPFMIYTLFVGCIGSVGLRSSTRSRQAADAVEVTAQQEPTATVAAYARWSDSTVLIVGAAGLSLFAAAMGHVGLALEAAIELLAVLQAVILLGRNPRLTYWQAALSATLLIVLCTASFVVGMKACWGSTLAALCNA